MVLGSAGSLTVVEESSVELQETLLISRPGPDPSEENYVSPGLTPLLAWKHQADQMTKVTKIFDMNTITNIPLVVSARNILTVQ